MQKSEVRSQKSEVRSTLSQCKTSNFLHKLCTQESEQKASRWFFIFKSKKLVTRYSLLVTLFFLLPPSSFLLSSCTFLYLPPVLPEQTVEATLDLSGSSGLSYAAEQLELSVFLRTIPQAGWLAVQWFAPNNKEVASDSLWIELRDQGLSQRFALPQKPSKGDWRVVVSFGDRLLRQFSIEIR
jgi:hypothetical protein